MRAVENSEWLPSQLKFRADAESVVAGLRGDHAERLSVMRKALAVSTELGDEVEALNCMIILVDSELAAGNAHAAASIGRTLVNKLMLSRDEWELALTRVNLCAALLALDACTEVRPVAEAGWSQARRFELQAYWADYLALLAALEQRPAAAAKLCGYSTAAYAVKEEPREVNEAAAFDRACRLAVSAMGDIEFDRLQAQGRSLRYDDIAAIAFGAGA